MVQTIDHMSEAEGPILRAMFEARKRVFVDLLKWDIPVLAGTWEIDHFDNPDASYLIVTDGGQGHLASARLLKTTGEHILADLYPDLVDGEVPRGTDVREITRFCLDRSLRASERRQARDSLVRALADHALENGIARYTGVAEIGWFEQIMNFGWDCKALGPPRVIGGKLLAAMVITIDQQTPAKLEASGIWTETDANRAARPSVAPSLLPAPASAPERSL